MTISEYWSPWDDQTYLDSFELEVEETLKEDWVKEELECGMTMDSIVDSIWKMYENWAYEERYKDMNCQY